MLDIEAATALRALHLATAQPIGDILRDALTAERLVYLDCTGVRRRRVGTNGQIRLAREKAPPRVRAYSEKISDTAWSNVKARARDFGRPICDLASSAVVVYAALLIGHGLD